MDRRKRRRQRRPSPETASPARVPRPAAALCATAVVLAVVAYAGAVHGPFVYDDRLTVTGNPSIRDLGAPVAIVLHDVFRPVVNLSYAVDHALWGLDPLGYHVTNLLLHLLNVVLLFTVARRLLLDLGRRRGDGSDGPAALVDLGGFGAAALLAVHPLMTEAVAYVSGRSELLATLFVLASLLLLRRALDGRRPWALAGGLVAFALGVLSKETAAMLPLLAVSADLLVVGGSREARRRRLLRFHVPLTALVVAAGAVRLAVWARLERGAEAPGLWQHLLTEAEVIWRYVGLLLLPVGQSIMHPVATVTDPLDPTALAALASLAIAVVALVPLGRRLPLVALGVLWFLLLLAPSHVVPLQEAMAEHRVYTAACGLFLAVAGGLAAAGRRLARSGRPALLTASVVLVPILAVLTAATVARARVWTDEVALWADAARKAPDTWGAQYAWADALRAAGRCDDAVPAYRRATELIPGEASAHLNLGICLAELGQFDEAWRALEAARRLAPDDPKPATNLGTLAARLGRYDQARASFRAAIALDPDAIAPRVLLAQLSEALGDLATAHQMCLEVRALAPSTPGISECLQRTGPQPSPPG